MPETLEPNFFLTENVEAAGTVKIDMIEILKLNNQDTLLLKNHKLMFKMAHRRMQDLVPLIKKRLMKSTEKEECILLNQDVVIY